MTQPTIVMLGGSGPYTRCLFHGIDEHHHIEQIITEDPVPMLPFLGRRVKSLGLLTVVGQVLFRGLVEPVLEHSAEDRIQQIIRETDLKERKLPEDRHHHVTTINSRTVLELIDQIKPDLVIVNGTRIIKPEIFQQIDAPVVNVHAGITPRYRGVHGGYWALVEGNPDLVGVTVHQIDEGIDTGPILYQKTVEFTSEDNFATYPYLQLAGAVPLLTNVTNDVQNDRLEPVSGPELESEYWSHPTIWGYLYHRLIRNIR